MIKSAPLVSGVTKSGRVWRSVAERMLGVCRKAAARSVDGKQLISCEKFARSYSSCFSFMDF